ncbi:MAG: fumarylacetoacetate hydrolase family protein [Myxococcales bacterium]|nr:fumarylacetoacetate hydrolase family protein [Myxococcales bacterium]
MQHVPGAIYCVGRNFVAHVRELGNTVPGQPVIFLKAPTSVRGLQPAPMAFPTETYSHELELVLRLGRGVPLGAAAGWTDVDAVTLGIDVTRREVQNQCKEARLPWTPSKSFAGSAVLGPFVPTHARAPGPIAFSLTVGGELRQQADTARMIFDVPTVLTHIASLGPLRPGDLVFTGTPQGVGPLSVGESFELVLQLPDETIRMPGVL